MPSLAALSPHHLFSFYFASPAYSTRFLSTQGHSSLCPVEGRGREAWGIREEPLLSSGRALFQGLRQQQATEWPLLKAKHFNYVVSFNAHSNSSRKFSFYLLTNDNTAARQGEVMCPSLHRK